MNQAPRDDLLEIFHAALRAVGGRQAVARRLQERPLSEPVRLVAVGKAAQAMARGAHEQLGERIHAGLVISKPGHLDPGYNAALGWEGLEGGHPLPDQGSLRAGERLLEFLAEGGREGLLFLISGGASSLLEAPVAGVDLAFLQRANDWLLASGLPIDAMNRVRKGLSRIKGGGLLQWLAGRPTRVLAISDVPGDDPAVIGSGLLVPDERLAVDLEALELPAWLRAAVQRGLAGRRACSGSLPEVEIVASLGLARRAAAERAAALGYQVMREERFIDGDAVARGRELAERLLAGPPGVSVWGGETTVRLPPHPGRGGRNQQLALAAAQRLDGHPHVWLLAAGTDGSDGPTGDAGALVDGETLGRARAAGLDPQPALVAADAGPLLEATGDLITTGPTGTNVMDLTIGLKTGVRA